MTMKRVVTPIVIGLTTIGALATVAGQERPTVQIPQSGVNQIMTMDGAFVRVAYNNEGYVSMGYQIANESVGQEWILLEVGVTVRKGQPNQTMKRGNFSIQTPDGKTIPLASNSEFMAANLTALQNRASVMRDSINYFPPSATRASRIGFFAELDSNVRPWDEFELSSQLAAAGRLFFHVPGGIKYGQHWLNVKFQNSMIRVPFRILTDEEEKTLNKNYKDIRQQVQEAFSSEK
jgi:hypothetical protein